MEKENTKKVTNCDDDDDDDDDDDEKFVNHRLNSFQDVSTSLSIEHLLLTSVEAF